MVVGGDPFVLHHAENVLRALEIVWICSLFTNPREFLEQLPKASIDLVLIDLDMNISGIHGLNLANVIQSSRGTANKPRLSILQKWESRLNKGFHFVYMYSM